MEETRQKENCTEAVPAIPKIYGAIASIMKETNAIAKSEKNQQQGFMFRGIDSVMNELHRLFAKYGVFILPEVQDYTVEEKTTSKGTLLYYTRAKVKFHFVAEDASEVCTYNVGEAMDSGDKGMNKAMSVALKYALMQMLLIPTKEDKDPDATTPEETVPKKSNIPPTQPQPQLDLNKAVASLKGAKTPEELQAIFLGLKQQFPGACKRGELLFMITEERSRELIAS